MGFIKYVNKVLSQQGGVPTAFKIDP